MPELDPSGHTPAYGAVDLDSCAREPIHIPGAIQPHGVLVALDEDLRAVMVSINVDEALGVAAEEAIGRPLADLLGMKLAREVADEVEAGLTGEPLVITLSDLPSEAAFAEVVVDVKLHRSGARLVVEVEPLGRESGIPLSYRATRAAMARLGAAGTAADLAAQLAVEIRTVLGFDRVMVYRFDEDWNGEVIAEERREDLNSFAGLHYPATDIPAQARRLYTINWTRLIADIGYCPVALHPVRDPATDAPLDLSFSSLRSVSPIHVEYLSNMGVGASMSISLVVEDELWGLVACHHYSGSHRPSHDARAAAEFLGQVASQLIVEREKADARESRLLAQASATALNLRVAESIEDPLASLLQDPTLLTLVDATGAAVSYDGTLHTQGEVPSAEVLERIAAALYDPDNYVTSTDRLAELLPDLDGSDHVAAGAIRIGTMADQWLLWLRPELPHVVNWGGDPTNKLLAATEGSEVRLSPRRSFEKWRQLVHGRSAPWQSWETEAADIVGRHLTNLMFTRSREHVVVAESLQRSIVLDQAPRFVGLDVAADYRPSTTYALGGDWWDAFQLDDGRIALVVGDTAGHGVTAVSAMTQIRTALRAYLLEGHGPGACLERLDHLTATLLQRTVATAVVAIADPAAGTLQIASAGHPQPIVVVPGEPSTATYLEQPLRPLLGVDLPGSDTMTVAVEPGTVIVLYTDGLIERRGVDLAQQAREFCAYAARTYDSDLASWLETMMRFDHAEIGDDDTTMLAIRFRGTDAAALSSGREA